MIVATTCRCGRLLTEQPKPGVFVCRDCKLAYPIEHGDKSIMWHYDVAVPIGDVLSE